MKRRCTGQSALARRSLDEGGFFNLRTTITCLLCAVVGCSVLGVPLPSFFSPHARLNDSERTLSFAERASYQRAIEHVYWRHRIWPKERPDPKPPLDSVMSQADLEKKVADYLSKSQMFDDQWHRPITAEQLQAEMGRMATNTKEPDVLRELFEALGNDPFIIAECLARPIVANHLLATLEAKEKFHADSKQSRLTHSGTGTSFTTVEASRPNYTLPVIAQLPAGCTEDTWSPRILPTRRAPVQAIQQYGLAVK